MVWHAPGDLQSSFGEEGGGFVSCLARGARGDAGSWGGWRAGGGGVGRRRVVWVEGRLDLAWGRTGVVGRGTESYPEVSEDHGLAGLPCTGGLGMLLHAGVLGQDFPLPVVF